MQAAFAAFGLKAAALPEEEEFWLWPDNVPAFDLWLRLQTQWRVGLNGRTGLDYSGVESCMRLLRVSRQEWSEMFRGVQAMEREVLEVIAQRRAANGN